jgi:4-amino-4-deoxy-L-arabinose transferase-like glycosyltransferase
MTSSLRAGRSAWPLAAAVFFLALAVRLFYLSELGQAPGGQLLYLDADYYARQAAGILGGDWTLGLRPFEMAPLYPFLLAGTVSLVGWNLQLLRLLQMLLGAAGCAATALAARRFSGIASGYAAGVLAALAGPQVFEEGNLLKEGLATAAVGFFLWGLACYGSLRSPRARGLLGLGILLGLGALLREHLLIVGFLFPLALAWRFRSAGWPRIWRAGAAFLIGLGLPLLPVAARNWAVGGEWVALTTSAGESFYIGNGPQANGFYRPPDFVRLDPKLEHEDFVAEASRQVGRRLSPGETSHYWLRAGLRALLVQPGRAATLYGRKLRTLVAAGYPEDNYSLVVFQRWCPILALLPGFGLLIPLALAGVVVSWKNQNTLILAFGAAYAAALLLFFAFGRFRLPLIPWLALTGGAALAGIARAIYTRSWKQTAGWAALVAAAFAGQRWLGLDPPEPPFYRNIFLLHVAEQRGDFAAMRQASRAVIAELDAAPGGFGRRSQALRAEAHLALGRAQIQTGRAGKGLEEFRQAYRGEPRPDLAAAIAGLEARLESPQVAERTLAQAVREFPADAGLRLQWAELLDRLGSQSRAQAQLEAAARIASTDPAVQFEAAERLKDTAAARRALDRFLRLRPEERSSAAVAALRERLN